MRPAAACLACLLLALVVPGAAAAPRPGSAPRPAAFTATADYCADAEEQAFLKLINDYRAQHGVGPLVMTQTLGAASDHHSADMAADNYFSHNLNDIQADGTPLTWSENMTAHGYTYNTYRGENLAAGNSSASGTFTQWKNSPGHNANMLDPIWKVLGIGRAYDADSTYKWYWTTDFAEYFDGAAKLCGTTTTTTSPTPTPTPSATPTPTAATGGTAYKIVRSTRTSGSNSSTYCYDGKPGTAWITNYSSTPKTYAYVYFDLGATKPIGSVQWVWGQTGYADSVKIQVSADRSTWTTLATVGNAPAGAWQTLKTSASGRYVRFYFANPNKDKRLGSLAEVKITS